MGGLRRSVGPVAALVLASCAAAPVAKPKPVEVGPSLEPPPVIIAPARWVAHPLAPKTAVAFARDGDDCLITASRGQRWRIKRAKGSSTSVCKGTGEAASDEAAQDLVAILHPRDKVWLFPDTSGALYEATDALGKLTAIERPGKRLTKIAGADDVVIAATFGGTLELYRDTSWRAAGAIPAPVLDVAVGAGGEVVALGFPETIYESRDGGATFAKLQAPPIGASRVALDANGDVLVEGLFESLVMRPDGARAFTRAARSIHPVPDLALEPNEAPSAASIRSSHAALDGDRYYGLVRRDVAGDWSLARGGLEGELTVKPRPGSHECADMRIAARGRYVAIACVRATGTPFDLVVERSEDGGASFTSSFALKTVSHESVSIAVGSDGSIFVGGACPKSATKDCERATALVARRPKAPASATDFTMIESNAVDLGGAPILPVFSAEAKSAYFIAQRSKDKRLAIFASADGGESFASRPLEVPGRPDREAREEESGERGWVPYNTTAFELDDQSSLSVAEDGTLGLAVRAAGRPVYLLATSDGKVTRASGTPRYDAIMAGYGAHLLGVARDRVLESADGGVTWDPVLDKADAYRRLGGGIACSAGGCVLGGALARVGWTGSPPEHAEEPPPPPPPPAPPISISCEMPAKPGWTRIETDDDDRSHGLPDENEAMRGRSVWSIVSLDETTAAASVVSAELPASGTGDARVATRPLLAPLAAGAHAALSLGHLHQSEGYSILRAPVSFDRNGQLKAGEPMRNVEIAWENLVLDKRGHHRIADAGSIERTDVAERGPLFQPLLNASLASVSSNGIFVVPHSGRSSKRTTYFFDSDGKTATFDARRWPERGLDMDLAIEGSPTTSGGALIDLGISRPRDAWTGLSILTAVRAAPGAKPGPQAPASVMSLLPPANDGAGTEFQWAYKGTAIGIATITASFAEHTAWAHFVPINADGTLGPAERLATGFDLPDQPKPCSASDRAAMPRLEWRSDPRSARNVAVQEEPAKGKLVVGAPIALKASGMIVHGTPASPCVAAWVAKADPIITAVIEGDLAHGWIFRRFDPDSAPPQHGRPRASIEYRPMTCKFDGAAHAVSP